MAVVPPFMLAMSICVANREPIPHSGSAIYDASLPVAENLRSGHEGLRQCETCCGISRCVRGPLVPLFAANQRRAACKIANGSSGAPAASQFCLAVCRCARSLSGSKAPRWIVCQPRTLTVLVPGNPLSGPPGFRGGPPAQVLGPEDLGPGERAYNKTWA